MKNVAESEMLRLQRYSSAMTSQHRSLIREAYAGQQNALLQNGLYYNGLQNVGQLSQPKQRNYKDDIKDIETDLGNYLFNTDILL